MLITRARMQGDDGRLTDAAQAWIAAIRGRFAGTPMRDEAAAAGLRCSRLQGRVDTADDHRRDGEPGRDPGRRRRAPGRHRGTADRARRRADAARRRAARPARDARRVRGTRAADADAAAGRRRAVRAPAGVSVQLGRERQGQRRRRLGAGPGIRARRQVADPQRPHRRRRPQAGRHVDLAAVHAPAATATGSTAAARGT